MVMDVATLIKVGTPKIAPNLKPPSSLYISKINIYMYVGETIPEYLPKKL